MKIVEQGYTTLSPISSTDIYCQIEQAGRTAYKSEDRITTGSADRFIRAIIERGHESVLEHISLSVRFICDRGVSHELVRHRLCSYTQESTRYCNYAGKDILFIKPEFRSDASAGYWTSAMTDAEHYYDWLIAAGESPQIARSVLPNSLKTEIVCTANIREWRHILTLRTSKAAHPQMRALMLPLLREFQQKLPVLFGDITA